MNMVKCKIDNRWMRGIEHASITVISPAGGSVTMGKLNIDKASDSLRELVWKIAGSGEEIELTIDEMQLLTTYPKASVYKKRTQYKSFTTKK